MPKLLNISIIVLGGLWLGVPQTWGRQDEAGKGDACSERRISTGEATDKTREILNEVVNTSFPEMNKHTIQIKTLRSRTTYFETRFSISRYLAFRGIRIIMSVNPCVFELGAPIDGIRAIIAHELGHADYYLRKNVFELVSLVRLVKGKSAATFERKTDLAAIGRGYGPGLIKYRRWLYRNIPQESVARKKRNYFTPEEIVLLIPAMASRPGLLGKLLKRVPQDIDELRSALR
jgi:hypothetical protein